MEDLSLFDELFSILWLLIFSRLFLDSAQAVIRDHCRRIKMRDKIKLRDIENEKNLRRTDK